MAGHTLNITKVNRVHMGMYRCIADNGIPPIANQTFQVDVYCECEEIERKIAGADSERISRFD